jgi:hypothetical protein
VAQIKKSYNWLKGKKVSATFAAVAFFAGFLFVDRGSISGNVILDGSYSVSAVSVIGLLLILCSAILTAYIIRKK